MLKFAKNSRTTIRVSTKTGGGIISVMFTSYEAANDFEEMMPGFNTPGWASWCALRLLHPVEHCAFESEIRDLFQEYKQGERKWITYNEEKRALLQRYLTQPYHQPKKVRR